MISVEIVGEAIDVAGALAALSVPDAGGIASFTGLVRADDGVDSLELEHYPGATERALQDLADTAAERWKLLAVTIVHRVGRMTPGETVVFVAAAASHRAPALEACAYLIDRLKTDAPFWKRETRGADSNWVQPRDADDTAAARWSLTPE